MHEIVWFCSYYAGKVRTEQKQELEQLKWHVDDIVRTVKGNPLVYLEYANSLPNNLQLTLETPNASGDLAFLDLNIKVNEVKKISCQWYQKSTDTVIIFSFRSCSPLKHKKNVVQGTVHRIFNAAVTGNPLIHLLRKIRRSGLKISMQLCGHPVLLMRRWKTLH